MSSCGDDDEDIKTASGLTEQNTDHGEQYE
jgi:hypothetical protein